MTINRNLGNLNNLSKKFIAKLGIVLLLCTISFVALTIPVSEPTIAHRSTLT